MNKVSEYATMIESTYKYYNEGEEPEDIGDWKPIELSDKFTVWKDDKVKEIVIANRGISLNNAEDFQTLTQEIIPSYTTGLRGGYRNYGSNMLNDYKDLRAVYDKYETEYEDYYIKPVGHSRGGSLALRLGRELDLETHAYAPVQGKILQYESNHDPNNINIYLTNTDYTPKFIRDDAMSNENKYVLDRKALDDNMITRLIGVSGHSIINWIESDNDNVVSNVVSDKVVSDNVVSNVVSDNVVSDNLDDNLDDNIDDNQVNKDMGLNLLQVYNLYPSFNKKLLRKLFLQFDFNGDKLLNTSEYSKFVRALKAY